MEKKRIKICTLVLCMVLATTIGMSTVQAANYWNPIAGTSDWVAMGGNEVDDEAVPADVVIDQNGLTVTYTGGEYTAGGSNAGVMYALPVDISDFSVEFTVLKRADYYNTAGTGCDSWISLCLLNKPDKYFNTKKAGESQGIVTLIRPMETHTAFEITQLTNNFAGGTRAAYEAPGDMCTTYKVEIKKNDEGIYDYIVNGVTVDFEGYGGSNFTSAFTRLMEKGEVYFYMGVSSKDSSQQIQWRITKINGKAVSVDQTVTPTEPKPTEPKPTEPKPTEPTQPTDPSVPTEPTEPDVTNPDPTDPEVTDPDPTDPTYTEPTPTKTEPAPTDAPTTGDTTAPAQTTPGGDNPEDPGSGSYKLWVILVIVAGAAIVLVVIFLVRRKK